MTPEKNVENKIRNNFIKAGGYINKSFASPHTNKGIPDLIGVINAKYVAIEVKRPTGGKPTPVQIINLQQIANAGGIAIVSNDPNIIYQISAQTKLTNEQSLSATPLTKIDKLTLPKDTITVHDATAAWTQTSGPHSLQLLAQSK